MKASQAQQSFRRERPQRLQQAAPRLRDQADRRRYRDVGDDVGGVFQPQTILDQPQTARLTDQGVKRRA